MRVLIILLFLSYSFYAQNNKKEILFDVNNDTISKDYFLKKVKRQDIGYSIFESDSILNLKLVKSNKIDELFEHYKIGKVDKIDKIKLINELENMSKIKINSLDIIIINFFKDEKDRNLNQKPSIDFYTSNNYFNNYFKKSKNIKQFFITEQNYIYNSKNTFSDSNKIIENLFFDNGKKSYCDYIIIYPNGDYILKKGEYRREMIIKFIKNYQKNN